MSGAPTGPAPAPKKDFITFEGDLNVINVEQRYCIIADQAGAPLGRVDWPASWDWKLKKQKVGYYVKAVCEIRTEKGQPDKVINCLSDWPWVDRPKDWPKPGSRGAGSGGRAPYRSPEDEKRISFNGILNSSIATVTASQTVTAMNPDQVRTEVLKCQQAYLDALDAYMRGEKIFSTPALPAETAKPPGSPLIVARG